MKFDELLKLMQNEFEINFQADIARELDVTPQTLNNWKIRDNVPYKYVKKIKRRIEQNNLKYSDSMRNVFVQPFSNPIETETKPLTAYIFDIILELKKSYKIFIPIVIVLIAFGLVKYRYFSPPIYEAVATIMPNSGNSNSSPISSISRSLGVDFMKGSVSISDPKLVEEFLTSKSFALKILDQEINTIAHGKNKKIINILSRDLDRSKDTLSRNDTTRMVENFRKRNIKILNSKNPNLVQYAIYFYEPIASSDIANLTLEKLDEFYRQSKKKKNTFKKKFIEQRIAEVNQQLSIEENNLKTFREKNRNINSSPELLLEQIRLMREVEVQNQTYITLLTQFELVNVEENEDSPIIEVFDPPFVPIKRLSPILLNFLVIYGLMGTFLGILSVYLYNGKIVRIIKDLFDKSS
jgi:uncharacterized protein involved in exopolysaccharide biosynthesis